MPTFRESGVGFVDETSWYGIFAPKGTSKDVIAKVNRDVNQVLGLPDIKARGATMGFRLLGGPPDQLASTLASEIARWAALARTGALTAN